MGAGASMSGAPSSPDPVLKRAAKPLYFVVDKQSSFTRGTLQSVSWAQVIARKAIQHLSDGMFLYPSPQEIEYRERKKM